MQGPSSGIARFLLGMGQIAAATVAAVLVWHTGVSTWSLVFVLAAASSPLLACGCSGRADRTCRTGHSAEGARSCSPAPDVTWDAPLLSRVCSWRWSRATRRRAIARLDVCVEPYRAATVCRRCQGVRGTGSPSRTPGTSKTRMSPIAYGAWLRERLTDFQEVESTVPGLHFAELVGGDAYRLSLTIEGGTAGGAHVHGQLTVSPD